MMRWTKSVILFICSLITTLLVSIIEATYRGQLIGGEAGIPFRFSDSSLFGGGETNYLNLSLDIIFWFVIIFIFQKYFVKLFSKTSN